MIDTLFAIEESKTNKTRPKGQTKHHNYEFSHEFLWMKLKEKEEKRDLHIDIQT